jgi:hypothetical protein
VPAPGVFELAPSEYPPICELLIHVVDENGGPTLAGSHLFLFAGVINVPKVLELLLAELSEPPLPCPVIVLLVDDLA